MNTKLLKKRIPARDLRPGDRLRRFHGSYELVLAVDRYLDRVVITKRSFRPAMYHQPKGVVVFDLLPHVLVTIYVEASDKVVDSAKQAA